MPGLLSVVTGTENKLISEATVKKNKFESDFGVLSHASYSVIRVQRPESPW